MRATLLLCACALWTITPPAVVEDHNAKQSIAEPPVLKDFDLEVLRAKERVAEFTRKVEQVDVLRRNGNLDASTFTIRALNLQLAIAELQLQKANIERAHHIGISRISAGLRERQVEMAKNAYEEAVHADARVPGSVSAAEMKRRRVRWEDAKRQLENAKTALKPTLQDSSSD